MNLTVQQILRATQNFSPSFKLGEGGFGTVYRAVLPDGQVVAVKRAKKVIPSAHSICDFTFFFFFTSNQFVDSSSIMLIVMYYPSLI